MAYSIGGPSDWYPTWVQTIRFLRNSRPSYKWSGPLSLNPFVFSAPYKKKDRWTRVGHESIVQYISPWAQQMQRGPIQHTDNMLLIFIFNSRARKIRNINNWCHKHILGKIRNKVASYALPRCPINARISLGSFQRGTPLFPVNTLKKIYFYL